MASTDDHLRDIKRLLLGIQGTIVGYVVAYAGGLATPTLPRSSSASVSSYFSSALSPQ